MKKAFYLKLTSSVLVLLAALMVCCLPQRLVAQCGNVQAFVPGAANYNVCSNTQATLYATGLPVTRWVYRDNNTGNWLTLSGGETVNQFISVSTNTTRYYRAVVSTPTCPTDTTAAVVINLMPNTYGINNNISITASSLTPCPGTSLVLRTMQYGYQVTAWLYKDGAGSWSNFTSSNEATHYIVNNTQNAISRQYRALLKRDNSCQIDSSAVLTVTIPVAVNSNNNNIVVLSTNAQTVCVGSSISLSVDALSANVGNWIYKDANTSNWVNFNSATNSTSDFPSTNLTTTVRSYKVLVRNSSSCGYDTSAAINFNINGITRKSVIAPVPVVNQTAVCAGTSTSFNTSGISIERWIYRDSATGNWTTSFGGNNVSFSTSSSITKPITRTVHMIINNISNGCSYDTSAAVTVLIKPVLRGNTTSQMPNTPSTEVCAGAQTRLNMPVNDVSNWLYRDNNNGNWNNTFSSGQSYSDNNTNVTTNTQRSYRVLISSTINCTIDTTAEVSVLIRKPSVGNIVNITPTTNKTAYCAGSSISGSISISQSQGVAGWLYRDNNAGNWLPFSSASTSFFDGNTQVNGSVTRAYRALIRNNETFKIDSSQQLFVVINARINGISSVVPTNISGTNACSGSTVQHSILLPSGYTVQNWLYKDVSSSFWSSFSFGNTTGSENSTTTTVNKVRQYKVLLYNESLCRYDSSQTVLVNINAKTAGNNNNILPTTSSGTNFCGGQTSISMSVSIPSGTTILRWIYSDNGGQWQPVSGGSASTFYTEQATNTRVLIPVIRRYAVIHDNVLNCTQDTSANLSVNLSPFVGGGTAAITPSSSAQTACAGTFFNLNFSYNGTVQKWIYQDNNSGPWIDFTNSSSSSSQSISAPYLGTVVNRSYRAILYKQGGCLVDTTQATTVQIKPSVNGNINALPILNNPTLCSGITSTASAASVASANVYKWIYRDNNAGEWLDFVNSSQSSFLTDGNTITNTNKIRTYRTIYVNTNTCNFDTSAEASVMIKPRTQGYAPQISITPNNTIYCAGNTINLSLNGSLASGSFVGRWLYSDNGNAWQMAVNSTLNNISHTNTNVTTSPNRRYLVVINNTTNCSYDTATILNANLNPYTGGYATTVTPSANLNSICQGSSIPSINVNFSSPYSMRKWMYSDNNGVWNDFPFSATSSTLNDNASNTSVSVNRNYIALLTNSSTCTMDTSNIVTVALNKRVAGNVNSNITTNRTNYCYGKQAALSTTIPSGYNGLTSWLYSDNGGDWKTINNTSTNLTDINTYVGVATSRVYRAILNNNNLCTSDTSNALSINISNSTPVINSTAKQPTTSVPSICMGATASAQVTALNGNTVSKWIYSDNGYNGPWYDAVNSSSPTLSHGNTFVNTNTVRLYKAIITDTTTCDFDSTLAVAITINILTANNDTTTIISGLDTICVGASISLSIPSGNYTVSKWQYSDNNSAWFDILNTSRNITDANTSVAPGTTRRYRVLMFNNLNCSYDTTTKLKSVFIKTKTYGNSTMQSNLSADTMCSGNTIALSVSNAVEKWLYKDGINGNWITIANSATTFLQHVATVTTPVWRYYRAVLNTNTCQGDSAKYDSVYVKFLTKGNIAIAPTGPSSAVCSGSSYNVNISVPSGASVFQWLSRTNGGIWQVYSNSSSTSIIDYNTNVATPTVREFRTVLFYNCSYDTTNAVSVAINPFVYGNSTKLPTVSSTNICAGSPITNITLSGETIVKWFTKENNGAWQVWYQGNSNNLTDYNTFVGLPTTRSYRAMFINNTSCSYDTSLAVVVTINPPVMGNSAKIPVVSSSGVCTGSSFTANVSVLSDSLVIGWLHNINGGAWQNRTGISQTTNSTINENNTYYNIATTLGYRAVTYKTSTCNIDTTAPAYVSVNTRTYGNISTTPTISGNTCTGTSYNVSYVPGSGNSIQYWLYRDNNVGDWQLYYTSSTSFNQTINTNTPVTRSFRALVASGTSCTFDTTNAASVIINPYTYGNDNAIVPLVSNTVVCSGGALSASVTVGGGNTLINWLTRDNYTGDWRLMNFNTSTVNDYYTQVNASINRTFRALIRKGTTCVIDTTNQDTATISPRLFGNDNTYVPTTGNNAICTGTPVTLSVQVTGGNAVLKWIYTDNGITYNDVPNSAASNLSHYNTSVTNVVNRTYRAIITKANTCTNDTSSSLAITISPRSYGNDNSIVPTTNNAIICAGGIAAINVNAGANAIERWLYKEGNNAWQIFSNANSSSIVDANSGVSVSTIRSYRALIRKANGCSYDSSAVINITFNPNAKGNQNSVLPFASRNSICTGSSVTLQVNGFVGSSVTSWLYKDASSSTWSVIAQPATSFTDYNTNVSTNTTRTYRAIVNNSTNCSYDTTGAVLVNISTITNGNTNTLPTTANTSVCSGTPVLVNIVPGANYSVQSWLYNTDGGNWNLFSQTSSTQIVDYGTQVNVTGNKSYRALLQSNSSCSLDTSLAIQVTLNSIGQGNSNAIPVAGNASICSGLTAQVAVTGTVVKWLFRDSIINTWSSINNTESTLYHTNTFVSYTRSRAYRAIVYNAATCTNDTTQQVLVEIKPNVSGNATTISPTTATPVICSGNTLAANVTGFINNGIVTGWVYRDNGGNWMAINGTANQSINHLNTTVTFLTNRQYRALVLTGCNTDTTEALSVTIDVAPAKPEITNPATTDSLICSLDATNYVWRKNGVVINGANAKVYRPTESGSYQVEIANASDCKTLSDVFTYTKVGLSNVALQMALTLYPNPTTTGQFTVDLGQSNVEQVTINVSDVLGRQVLHSTQTLVYGKATLALEAAKTGVYFVTIEADGATVTKRLVVK